MFTALLLLLEQHQSWIVYTTVLDARMSGYQHDLEPAVLWKQGKRHKERLSNFSEWRSGDTYSSGLVSAKCVIV